MHVTPEVAAGPYGEVRTLVDDARMERKDRVVRLRQVAAEAKALCQRTHACFVLDSFTHIERGGRIGKAAAITASILKITPILTFTQGVTDVEDRPRTKKVALERLWAIIDKHAQKGIEYIGFQYGANRAEVEGFQHDSADGFHPDGDA